MTITSETLRRADVIADKIEDGSLFRGGILSRAQLAETLRAVIAELQRLEAERLTLIDHQAQISIRNVDLQFELDRLRTEADTSPAQRLIASHEVIADGPVRVTRLRLSDECRAGLTSTAAGPLPGITGGLP